MLRREARSPMFWVFWLIGATLLAFIALPLLALLLHPTLGDLRQVAAMADVRSAIGLSLGAALFSTVLAAMFAVPLAYVLARQQFRGKSAVEALVDLPLTIPHTIAGIALLLVFSRGGWLGAPLAHIGLEFWGTFAGIVLAMSYVGLPLARQGIGTGLTLCFARAIGEFAAVVLLAYYPMTAPIRIYDLFLQSGLRQSVAASVLFLLVVMALFWGLRLLASARAPQPAQDRQKAWLH